LSFIENDINQKSTCILKLYFHFILMVSTVLLHSRAAAAIMRWWLEGTITFHVIITITPSPCVKTMMESMLETKSQRSVLAISTPGLEDV